MTAPPPRFVPLRLAGRDVVFDEPVPGQHFERLHPGAWRGVDGDGVPVVVHLGPGGFHGLDADTRAAFGDDDAFVQARRRLRTLLGGHAAPRVLANLIDDGSEARPRGRCVGYVEEWAGDVRVVDLLAASRAAGGALPVGVALAIARAFATPFAALERLEPGAQMEIDVDEVRVDVDGVVRSLVDPFPRWSQMAVGTAVGGLRAEFSYMPPEQVRGVPSDHRRAMFKLGVLLFELVAGEHPLEELRRRGPLQVLQALVRDPIPSLAARFPDTPSPVALLVARLTARAREDRFARWADVLASIDGAAMRTEQATPADVAAVVRGLLPDAVAAAEERREHAGLLDFDRLTSTLVALPGVSLAAPRREPVDDHAGAAPLGVELPVAALPEGWDDATPADVTVPYLGRDGRGMLVVEDDLRVDVAPVSHDAWGRFCLQTGRAPLAQWRGPTPPPELAELPVTGITPDDARAYAAFYAKDLPSNDEWQRAVDLLGAQRLGVGSVWEWTATPHLPGWVVRGGRYRDRPGVPSDGETTAWEDGAAADVGFRCVSRVR